ncbi:MAG: methyltransferase domain-containing protein [Spirochaetia bacterium]
MNEKNTTSNRGIEAVRIRYGDLAESSCCLSCGAALSYAKPEPGEVCVDLGSGRGHDVVRMAEAVGPEGRVYGIDISEKMIAKARRNAAKLEAGNAEFILSELEAIPLPDQSADLLISNCTINHAADKQRVWNEVFRVLKPGGRFVVSDIYSLEPVPAEYAGDPQAVAECWAGAVTKEEYIDHLSGAGFTEVTILEESEPYDKGKVRVASFTIQGYKEGV